MNFNTLTPGAKVLKKLQNYCTGQAVTAKDAPLIAVINASEVRENKALIENICFGIKSSGGYAFVYNVQYFGYSAKINPISAKYAGSFRSTASANAQAIIRTNMADGVVIVTDCDITACGLLDGCMKVNCPAVVMPLGAVGMHNPVHIASQITMGQITAAKGDEILQDEPAACCQSAVFNMLEQIGLCVQGTSTTKRDSGKQLILAQETGKQAVSYAGDIKTPKKLFTKIALEGVTDFCLGNKFSVAGLVMLFELFNANEVKTPHDYINGRIKKTGIESNVVYVTGTAVGEGAYIQHSDADEITSSISGKAWVYQSLEDADKALLGGNIPADSVVVLQNCVGVDVSAFAYAIQGMNRRHEIAIATDGTCDVTDVLTVTLCSPDSFENEEFANIQNGDQLDIDVAKGRFNTSVLSKDFKNRAKRNAKKTQTLFF